MPGTIIDARPAHTVADNANNPENPGDNECLRCYLTRMLDIHGCDNTKRWTKRWRDRRAPRDKRLLRRIEDRGGICCDCEVIFNVWEGGVWEGGVWEPGPDSVGPENSDGPDSAACSGSGDIDPLVPCGLWSDTSVAEPQEDYGEECW